MIFLVVWGRALLPMLEEVLRTLRLVPALLKELQVLRIGDGSQVEGVLCQMDLAVEHEGLVKVGGVRLGLVGTTFSNPKSYRHVELSGRDLGHAIRDRPSLELGRGSHNPQAGLM